ncbi:MAG: phage terminase small subunit P27 family [Desulfamplus sp.]|nr:phage terminase small subunit P27 family [Desulfamplus sp.]
MKIDRLWLVPPDMGEYGKALWKRIGKDLVESGSLDSLDRESFDTMCRNYDRMRVADKQMTDEGVTVDGRDGPKKHPAFPVWKTAFDNYVKLSSHFGLTPMSRGFKVTPTEKAVSNEKAQFFTR